MLRPGLLSLIASALLVLGLERSASSQIFITEILYNAEPVNTGGEFVELHNSGKEAVDVGNWVLVDAVNYSFPSGTTIEPGAYVVIARNATEAAEFYGVEILGEYAGALSNGSDSVILQDDSIPRRIIDSVTYADVAPWPIDADGTGPSLELLSPDLDNGDVASWGIGRPFSPAQANDAVVPVDSGEGDVVINEIMYKPKREELRQDQRGEYMEDGEDHLGEYVEIYNRSEETIDLQGWSLGGGVRFTFEEETLLPPSGFLVICGDPAATRIRFDIQNVVGPFEGILANDGERIFLRDGDGRLVDVVRYNDRYPWPVTPDEDGISLECVDPLSDNSTAANWRSSLPELAAERWQRVQVIGEATGDRLLIFAEDAGEWLIDSVSLAQEGGPNIVLNGEFEENIDGWETVGNHSGSVHTSEDAFSGAGSLKIIATGSGSGLSNHVRFPGLAVTQGEIYTLEFRALHLSGDTTLNMRLAGGGLSFSHTAGGLPSSGGTPPIGGSIGHGTPGVQNLVRAEGLPPLVEGLMHQIERPTSNDAMPITARVHSFAADGALASVDLLTSINLEEEVTTLPMFDDGMHGDGAAGDGVFGVTVPPQPSRTLLHYSIVARDTEGLETVFPYRGEPSPTQAYYHFDNDVDTALTFYDVFLTDDDMSQLLREPLVYIDGSVVIDGIAYPHMDIRYRGQRSLTLPKKQWKFRFNRHQHYEGNSHIETMANLPFVQEVIFEMFDAAGTLNLDSELIRVHRNGDFYGVYIAFEMPNTSWLAKHEFHPDGEVYKARSVSLTVGSTLYQHEIDTDFEYWWAWNKKTRGLEKPDEIRDLTENLNRLPASELLPWMEKHIDLDQWFKRWALYIHMNVDDFTAHNYYMFLPGDPGAKWIQLAYDFDSGYTFSRVGPLRALYGDGSGVSDRDDWQNGKFYNIVANNPTLTRLYFHTLSDINTFYDADVFLPMIDEMFADVTTDRNSDRSRWNNTMRLDTREIRSVFSAQKARTLIAIERESLPEDVRPACLPPGGSFDGRVLAHMGAPPEWDVVYTTDGRDPRLSDTAVNYDGPIWIEESTEFRVAARRGPAEEGDWTRVRDFSFSITPLPEVGPFVRGDCDGDGEVVISDAIHMLVAAFTNEVRPLPCLAACDTTAEGILDISDPFRIITFQFLGAEPAPAAPFPGCGVSTFTSDVGLGCETPPAACGDTPED